MTSPRRWLFAVTLLAWVAPAGAQEYNSEAAVAYSLGQPLYGPSLSTSGRLGGPWSVSAQLSVQGGGFAILMGPRVARHRGSVRPYAAFLLGPALVRGLPLVLAPQIGADLMLSSRVALRVGGDVMSVRDDDPAPIVSLPEYPWPYEYEPHTHSRTTAVALRAGVVFSFGHRPTHAGR